MLALALPHGGSPNRVGNYFKWSILKWPFAKVADRAASGRGSLQARGRAGGSVPADAAIERGCRRRAVLARSETSRWAQEGLATRPPSPKMRDICLPRLSLACPNRAKPRELLVLSPNRRRSPAAVAARGRSGEGHAGGDTADRGPFMARRRGSAAKPRSSRSAGRRDNAALQSRLDRLRDLVRRGGPDRAARRPGDRGRLSRRRRGTAERRRSRPPCRRHRRPAPPARSRFAGRRSAGESRSPGCPPKRPRRPSRPTAAAPQLVRMAIACPGDLAGRRDRALLLLMAAGLGRRRAGRSRRRAAALHPGRRRTHPCW